jgi:hypothetical protein
MSTQPKDKVSSSTNDAQIIRILAVKASEENSKQLLSAMVVSNANISAISAKSDMGFIGKRADYLFKLLPAPIRLLENVTRFPGNWIKLTVLISFVIGLLSNYLGPSKLIHAVYNPLTILLLWSLLIYLLMVLKRFWKIRLPETKLKMRQILPSEKQAEDDKLKKKKASSNFLVNWIIGEMYKIIIQLKSKFIDNSTKVTVLKKIIPAFLVSYQEVAGRTLVLRFKSLLNASAVGLLIGALTGVYFRGLFYNYNIIWQSTFVSEPETIRTMLNILYGPATLILDGNWVSPEMVRTLMHPEGAMAGPWIHKMALTTLLFIFIPRTLLSVYFARKSKYSTKEIDISQSYYKDSILKNRESLVEIIREGIREIISKKIEKTALSITDFVINDYFEKIIVPILTSFRNKGGKIRKLEEDLLRSQHEFVPILSGYLDNIQDSFKQAILTEINLFLGRKFEIDISNSATHQPQSDQMDQKLPRRLAEDISDTLGGTIVTGVTLAAGAIRGGLGKSLGIAIISGLIGVSGPIGLLIGSLLTLAAVGGAYTMGRDKISKLIKEIYLPPLVIKMALSDAKIEKARQDTFSHTQSEIKKVLEPKVNEITDAVLKDIAY